ncbi:MAG: AN1-type zinc finger protein [Candidatus Odinarchaeota archaeon]
MNIEKEIVISCKFCGKKVKLLPFKCKFCGANYCADHRLPESHECSLLHTFHNSEISKSVISEPKMSKVFIKDMIFKFKKSQKINGTVSLFLIILILSILTVFIPQYLCPIGGFYGIGFFPQIWTLFTSIFV